MDQRGSVAFSMSPSACRRRPDSCVMRPASDSWLMRHASWLMRHASGVMAHGSWLMAHASGVRLMAHASCVRRRGSCVMRPASDSWLMRHGSCVMRTALSPSCVPRAPFSPFSRRPLSVMTTTGTAAFFPYATLSDLRPLSYMAWGNRVVLPPSYSAMGTNSNRPRRSKERRGLLLLIRKRPA